MIMTITADYNAGDTVPFAGVELVDDVIVTPQAGATIDIYRDGTLIVTAGACTEKAGTGIVYYDLASAVAGTHDYIITFASGYKAEPGRIVVGLGTGALEATAQTILADTNELQTNQGNWLTATGFSTFDPAIDEVITDSASREASKASLTGIALSSEIAALNDLSDTEVWASATRTLTASPVSQDDFDTLMDTYFTQEAGNTPGVVPPPPSIDLVRVYVNLFNNEDETFTSINPNISIIGAYRYSDKIFAFDKNKWTYSGGVLQFLVPAYCQISITVPLSHTDFYKKGYVGAGGSTIDAYDLYETDQTPV